MKHGMFILHSLEAWLAPAILVLVLVFEPGDAVLVGLFVLMAAVCLHCMAAPYRFAQRHPRGVLHRARIQCAVALQCGLALWLCFAFVSFGLLGTMFQVNEGSSFIFLALLSAVMGLLSGLVMPFATFSVLHTGLTGVFFLLSFVMLVATGPVLGLRALRTLARRECMPRGRRIGYTVFLCLPTLNLVPLLLLREQLRQAGGFDESRR